MEIEDLKSELDALRAELVKVKTDSSKQLDGLQSELAKGKKEHDESAGPQVVFAPKQRKVEKFSGKKGQGPSVYEFAEEMGRILKTRPTPIEEQVDFVLSNLEGLAKEEMRYRPLAEKKSPKVVLGILEEVFGERSTISELLSDFYQTRQVEGQSLQEYSHLIMSKLDRIYRVDGSMVGNRNLMLRNQLAENVFEPWLRRELKKIIRVKKDITFTDLREEAILLCQDQEKPTKRKVDVYTEKTAPKTTQADSELAEILKCIRSEMSDLKKEVAEMKETRGKPRNIQCYGCKEYGHIKRNCPNKEQLNK